METLIYEQLDGRSVRCGICSHFCTIKDGKKGICGVRRNDNGKLVSLIYPKVVAAAIDPIEKKPLYHVRPGSFSYSIASPGCNLKCTFCQNASIAQIPVESSMILSRTTTVQPEAIVSSAMENGCESISYTYTEPTVFFELAFETAKIAKEKGLLNIFVTNGFMSPDALEMISPYLDAANVDLKAFDNAFYKTYCKASIEPVKANLKAMKEMGIMVEVTTLLIPELNDSEKALEQTAGFIAGELGPQTPWHISRFHPCHEMTDRHPTPVATLERAWEAGHSAGLHYVYIGNVPGHPAENTTCHSCGTDLIERRGYRIKSRMKHGGICPDCKTPVFGIF